MKEKLVLLCLTLYIFSSGENGLGLQRTGDELISFLHWQQIDTTKMAALRLSKQNNLQTKMLGVWRDVDSENATFEIKSKTIYYFEHNSTYKYSLKGNLMSIQFPDYTFTGKVRFVQGMLIIDSKEFGVSKYKKIK